MSGSENNFDAFGEQTQKLNSAMKFTNGDMEKARLVIAGKLNDVKAVKCCYTIEGADIFAYIIIFVGSEISKILYINTRTFSDKSSYEKLTIFDAWKLFYSSIDGAQDQDAAENKELMMHIGRSIEGYDVFPDIAFRDNAAVTNSMLEMLKKYYNIATINCQVSIDDLTSITAAENGVPLSITDFSERGGDTAPGEEIDDRPQVEKEADFVLPAKVIVSPVRGKYINDIGKNEKIKLLFLKDDPISVKVARTCNAYTDEGEFLPVSARLKEKVPQKKGYILYCVVAKGVLAKIIEEENVKIDVEQVGADSAKKKNESAFSLYLILLVVLILVTFAIIYAIL